jgi:hypothetical protein
MVVVFYLLFYQSYHYDGITPMYEKWLVIADSIRNLQDLLHLAGRYKSEAFVGEN